MRAVILAAGEGKRLRPFTTSEPKVMIPVANKPILAYVIESLVENNIREMAIVVGYKRERIMSYFGDGKNWGAEINYIIEPKQLGTGHSLLAARDFMEKDFFVLPGDNVIDAKTVGNLIGSKKDSILITNSENPSKYGEVVVSGTDVKEIIENPKEMVSNLINTGIYHFSDHIFDSLDYCTKKGRRGITSAIQESLDRRVKFKSIKNNGIWMDAVYPWDLLSINGLAMRSMKTQTAGKIEKGVTLKGDVFIGEDSVIRSGTYIIGPTIIGEGCEIGPHVCIFPSTTIGDDVQIRPFTTISHSLIMRDCLIGPGSTVSHSVMGEGVRVGSHFASDSRDSTISWDNSLFEVKNIGTMVGEDTRVGDQVVVRPGTILGANARISSLSKVREHVPNDARVV